jgi:internalin A
MTKEGHSEESIAAQIIAEVGGACHIDYRSGHVSLRRMGLERIPAKAIEHILSCGHAIRNLYLYNNKLTIFPVELCDLPNLEVLNLDNNELVELPPQIKNLRNLRSLSLANNHIHELPLEIADLPLLKNIDIKNNPLPESIITTSTRGAENLRAYLRSLQAGATELFEVKILFVGEGGVGKSSLLGALRGEAFIEHRDTTHGIEIKSFNLPHLRRPNKQITFNAWDFGGQEVYRISHQFFYSKRSLYLILWSPRIGSDQSHVEEWLEQIVLRVGKEAKVIVIATSVESCDRLARIDKTYFLEKFKGIVLGFFEVDSKTEFGIDKLKKVLSQTAAELPQMGDLLSTSWNDARERLQEVQQPYLSYDLFSTVFKNAGGAHDEIRAFADLHHDLGYIVYFGEDEGLRDIVILQPEWLTKAIGYVLEDKTTDRNSGVLQHNRLRDIWHTNVRPKEPKYDPSLHPFFLRLMEKFDISYRLEGGEASLVAQLVPYDKPVLPWNPGYKIPKDISELSIVCRMSYRPPGLIPWMIVRTSKFAPKNWRHWRKGTYLEYGIHGTAVLETADLDLLVTVRGRWPTYFMDLLRYTMEMLILERWPGLTYSFSAPCPKIREKGQRCKGHFPLETLQRLRNQVKDNMVPCLECGTQFKIDHLLSGFSTPTDKNEIDEIKNDIRKILTVS